MKYAALAVACVCLLFPGRRSQAAPGDLDPTFGTGGLVTMPTGAAITAAEAIALQADGDIVAAGTDNGFVTVARYLPDGTLDPTFGVGGVVMTPGGGGNAIAIQGDGKIVVAGFTGTSPTFAVFRYLTDGNLDANFGTGGVVTTSFGVPTSSAHGVTIQGDGAIVAAGQAGGGSAGPPFIFDFAVARYLADGTLDATFGSGGTVLTSFGSSGNVIASGNGLVLQGDGKIVVGGSVMYLLNPTTTMSGPALARFNPDGSLDTTFGSGGIVIGPLGNPGSNGLSAIAVQASGNIVGTGTIGDEGAFVRYLASGALDPTFGTDGVATVLHVGFGGLSVQSDGSYVGVGESVSRLLAVVRTLSDGTLDPTFGVNGVVTTAFPAPYSFASASAVVIRGDGKIVAAGLLENSQGYEVGFALARYFSGTGAPPADQCAQVGGSRGFLRAARPTLTLRNVSTPRKGTLSLRASFVLPTGISFSDLTPATDGARLVIDSATGAILVDVSLAAGTYGGKGTRGWRTNSAHSTWTFTDATGTPVNGVTGMTITDESRKAPGQVGVRVKGNGGTYPAVLSDIPVQVVVVLGGAAASAAGECGQSEFDTTECHLASRGSALICKLN
jgi:uncharacterized delta-60 repeat protein